MTAERPVVVVSGLPRSGTSMMMQMLARGGLEPLTDHERRADDDNPHGYYEFERVKQAPKGDVGWLPDARGKAVKVIAALLPYLPPTYRYRVIFMRRAMPEVLASQRAMLVRRGADPDAVGDAEMARLFDRHLARVDAWVAQQPHIARLDVAYGELLARPGEFAARVNRFLGGGLDEARMVEAVDPRHYRQGQTGAGV
jgi:hypothetical protein